MLSNLNRHSDLKSKQLNSMNNGLMTAQMTIRPNNIKANILQDSQIEKMIAETDAILKSGEPLQIVNHLQRLKQSIKSLKNRNLNITLSINLGVSYYQVGFLEEAYEQFVNASSMTRDIVIRLSSQKSKTLQRINYERVLGKVQLQTCILFSQMGKHEIALEHAKISCKIHYDLIYDTLISLYLQLNSILYDNPSYPKNSEAQIFIQGHQNLLNNISVLSHLIKITKDLKNNFFSKEKAAILSDQVQISKKFGKVSNRINIQTLYGKQQQQDIKWIYKNKILDEIQLHGLPIKYFQLPLSSQKNSDVIERIIYLAISLYCFSTQTRFVQKSKEGDLMEVLDSQHWLSRSLQIAYMFLPPQAPILNQILTVHDRFHGIDKQTIPEDKEVSGFFKVLRPLSKPKSIYSSKSPMCSPILIRIQASKLTIDVGRERQDSKQSSNSKKFMQIQSSNTIDIDVITKNNKIRGLSRPKMFNFMEFTQTNHRKPRIRIQSNNYNLNNHQRKTSFQNKTQHFRLNLSELDAKPNEIRTNRPHSYDRNISSLEDPIRINSQRKKKVLTSKKHQSTHQPSSNKNPLQLDGFQLIPPTSRRIEENAQQYQLFKKITNTHRMLEATKLNGNVFINNNINLFIAKEDALIQEAINKKHNKTSYHDINRRQDLVNKRKSNQAIIRLAGISQ